MSGTAEAIAPKKPTRLSIVAYLGGMMLPPNYGQKYTDDFTNVFYHLAREYPITFMPFLLKDVAGHAELNLPDGQKCDSGDESRSVNG